MSRSSLIKIIFKSALLIATVASISVNAGIGGTDERSLAIESHEPGFIGDAISATAALVLDGRLQLVTDNSYQLKSDDTLTVSLFAFSLTPSQIFMSDPEMAKSFSFELEPVENLAEIYGIPNQFCPDEKFARDLLQASDGVFCSSVLISEQFILTAGHCVNDMMRASNEKVKVVFGYTSNKQTYPQEAVYEFGSADIRKFAWKQGLYDYAIIKLDRKVEGIKPVVLNLENDPSIEDSIYGLGFPFGFPMVLSKGNIINHTFNKKPHVNQFTIIKSDLDVFPGNSGGPVFNQQGQLLGINIMVTQPHLELDLESKCYRWFRSDEVDSLTQTMPVKLIKEEITEALKDLAPEKKTKKKKQKRTS